MSQDQTRTVAFLSSPAAFGGSGHVEVVETHGAFVFLCGGTALKLKRAIRYDYMDLSTREKRYRMLERELELNRAAAPEIYRDVLAVTRAEDGTLALGGRGEPVDWVLRMHRFPAEAELTAVAARGDLDDKLAAAIGTALASYHGAATVHRQPGSPLIGAVIDELERVFAEFSKAESVQGAEGAAIWLREARQALSHVAPVLDRRGNEGHVRRAHGDLHLRNIVLMDGRPVPYDALEFDETLGTCDLLYDLGFLLMDLCHRGLDRAACRVLDAWLTAFRGTEDDGLAGLPLFLSVRAAIRAMVLLQTDAARGQTGQSAQEIGLYLRQAQRFLTPSTPVLIPIGGFSGTGKSVLARDLAPGLGAAPGAVIVSSDATRKAGLPTEVRLPGEAYEPSAREAVYRTLIARARTILSTGHSVILDATFLDPAHRQAAEQAAMSLDIPFSGIWLEAPRNVLEQRVSARRGDASDADLSVLQRQLAHGAGSIGWARFDTSQDDWRTVVLGHAWLSPWEKPTK